MVRPLPLPPDGNISNRRLAQIRRRHREKILKTAQRQKNRQEAAEQKRLDKLSSINKIENSIEKNSETIEIDPEREAEPQVKEDDPNSPRRILRDIQTQRLAKRKKSVPVGIGEFYPDKLKRKVVYKKIRLTPNQELVPLGSVNKRKRNDPKKGEEYEQILNKEMSNEIEPKPLKRKVRNIIREETVEEIIMRIEETDSLTDEDLMEILTCPSPVWWEEPLNPFYFDEEPINKKLQKPNRKRPNQASIKQKQTVNQIDRLEINLENRDQKFVAKRSTLENILSNIKDNIEPATNAQISRKQLKRPWKDINERNPAFGFKRNSKGRFLKKKFGSSPIIINDVSDIEESNLNNSKVTSEIIDLDKATHNNVDITKITDAKTIGLDKTTLNKVEKAKMTKNINLDLTGNEQNSSEAIKTSEFKPKDIVTKDLTNNINESSIGTVKTNIKKAKENKNTDSIDLKTNKDSESPKTLTWTGNNGESKVINFTQDSEMSSDGVEIVTESEDLNIPEMPPLKWYPKTETTKNSVDKSNTASDASNEELEKSIEADSNMELIEEIDMISSKTDDEHDFTDDNNLPCNEIDKTSNKDDTIYIIDGNINDTVSDNVDFTDQIDKESVNNDTYSINGGDIHEISSENDIDITEINITAEAKSNDTAEKTTETTQKTLLGVFERSMDYFRKKSKDIPLDGTEEDKKRDDYVVVYKIDETFKDTNADMSEELEQIGDFNEIFEENEVSGTL